GQCEAVRNGVGLGVLHHFIAAGMPEVEPVLPERRAHRTYWLVIHEDVRALGRIRAVVDFITREAQAHRHEFLATG
ncbi:MAG TPA: LysR family transcriptional regulator, partial [Rhabdaerophilum sp.]|nr:LysR family transcriptional regulator [Rhabdaerophilum sp.]